MRIPNDTEIEKVLEAFAFAETYSERGDEQIDNAPFLMAEMLGWDWESDEAFTHWALKATQSEIAIEGRKRFLAWVNRKSFLQGFALIMKSCEEKSEDYWSSFIWLRNLTDDEVAQIESGGFGAGLIEGRAYRTAVDSLPA
jgi:hypothetical protein